MKTQDIQPYTIAEIDKEIADLDKKIEDVQKLVQKRTDLHNLKLLMIRLRTGSAESATLKIVANGSGVEPKKREKTADIATRVLNEKGKMSLEDLLKAVRLAGWQGSGDDAVDKKRIYAAMWTRKDQFEFDEGLWSISSF